MEKCSYCDHELSEGVLVCGYCGHSIPKDQLSEETKKKVKAAERSDESLKPDTEASVRYFGYVLMGIGGLCDIAGMAMIGSGSVEAFSATCIGGTICFGVGLFIAFFGRA